RKESSGPGGLLARSPYEVLDRDPGTLTPEAAMRFLRKGWTTALMLALATPVAAQEHEVARRTFTFIENNLTIEVLGQSPGALHIVRGQPGQIEVAARAADGIAGFGLAGEARDRLKLTAVGA